jgi:nitroreductase
MLAIEVSAMSAITTADLRQHALRIARSAGMAPSHHNSQPWSLGVGPQCVEVWADRDRRPEISDPDGRQVYIGAGAALFAVRLEIAELGWVSAVEALPDPSRPDLAARVRITGAAPVSPEQHALWQQIPRRRTIRARMRSDLDRSLQRLLALHVAAEGCGLRWIEADSDRRALASLVALAERSQQRDPRVLGELARWLDRDTVAAGAGIPAYALGPSGDVGHAAEFPLRDFSGGAHNPPASVRRPEPHPAVAVLTTGADGLLDWLEAGQAMMRLLLAATAQGLAASFLNQPLEDVGLRAQVRSDLALPGAPQMVLRLGRPTGVWPPASPRRPPAELLRYPPVDS